MTASGQRKKNRKRASDKRTQINNQKKLDKLKKIRKNVQYDKRGRVKDTKPNQISNIGKNADYGQRAAKLKQSMGGIGSMKDYKKTEKKAFKEAEKFKKTQAKEKLKIKKNKERKAKTKVSRKGVHNMKGFIRKDGKIYSKRSRAGKELMKKLNIRR